MHLAPKSEARLLLGIVTGYVVMLGSLFLGLWALFGLAVTSGWYPATTPDEIRMQALAEWTIRLSPITFLIGLALIGTFSTIRARRRGERA